VQIKNADCAVVLGNLLDNALEACAKLPCEQRWIEVKIVRNTDTDAKEATLFISVLNASLPVKIKDQSISTTKPNPSFHGYGLPNIKTVLNRYGADYVLAYRDSTFQFTLEWPEVSV
jgi:sensor histidine kinase regulating citrate/malate metabolism